MRIIYYGTAAGEAMPCKFCECDICKEARRRGGRNLRTRSQTLIDEDLLIDFPPDNLYHADVYGLDFTKIKNLLVTHNHSDHFYPMDLEFLRVPFSYGRKDPLHIYGNTDVGRAAELLVKHAEKREDELYDFTRAVPFETYTVGDYEVTPLLANHDRTQECLIYLIRSLKEDKTVLYGHDTGFFPEATVSFLKEYKYGIDFVSLDATMGDVKDGVYHMGLKDAAFEKSHLISMGIIKEGCIWVINHFSHNGHMLYEELAEQAKDYEFITAYEGLELEF